MAHKFKVGDRVKVYQKTSIGDDYHYVYNFIGTIVDYNKYMNDYIVKPDLKYLTEKEIEGSKLEDPLEFWTYDHDDPGYGGNVKKGDIITNYSIAEDNISLPVKSTELSKFMYPDAIEENGWLYV
jgi:hypothetical protein